MKFTRTSGRTLLIACALATALTLWSAPGAAAARPDDPGAFGRSHRQVCGAVPAGFARCHSEVVTDAEGNPLVTPGPDGYGPDDLQSAYNIFGMAASAGGTQTIGIVDAYDDPNAESDLAVYRMEFGLPPCTTGNGCFKKVNQKGETKNYPAANSGWAQEISLDLDMASAICPNCSILLVEADSNLFTDLATAVDQAAALGATQVSNSYGGKEFKGEDTYESHYNHPGVTVSSGDSGYGAEFPASSRYVTAVGGTTLTTAANARGWSETVWSGAGSGCSAYITKPAWQTDSGCTNRTVADVSAVADPNTGVAVYDSYKASGWLVFGGTSAAAPIVAGFDALIGSSAGTPKYAYDNTGSYYDVTSGSNGNCGGSYLCTGLPGYDGPTGWGTPKGTGGTAANRFPTPAFTISPNPAQTGQIVTFDGSASKDRDGSITDYKWDLDGNGTFETDTGTTSSVTKTYGSAQSLVVTLRVTDNDNATSDLSHQLTVNSASNQPPTVDFTWSPNPAQTNQTISFTSTAKDPDGTITGYSWTFGDGGTDTNANPTHSYSTAGIYSVTVTVTDNQGAKGSSTHSVQVNNPSTPSGGGGGGSGGGGTGGGGSGGSGTSPPPTGTTTTPITISPVTASPLPTATTDTVRPAFLSLSLSPTSFHAARAGASIRAAVATGARVSFSLSERATVNIRVERATTGRRVGGRCRPVTASNRSAPRCTRYVLMAGQFSRAGQAGANAFRFMGRLAGRALRPNRYRLVLTATDAAGNRSLARRLSFRIV